MSWAVCTGSASLFSFKDGPLSFCASWRSWDPESEDGRSGVSASRKPAMVPKRYGGWKSAVDPMDSRGDIEKGRERGKVFTE